MRSIDRTRERRQVKLTHLLHRQWDVILDDALEKLKCSKNNLRNILAGRNTGKCFWPKLMELYGISKSQVLREKDDLPIVRTTKLKSLTARLGGTGPVEVLTIEGHKVWIRQQDPTCVVEEGAPTFVLLHGLALTPAIFQGWFWNKFGGRVLAPFLSYEDSADGVQEEPTLHRHAETVSRILAWLQSRNHKDVVIVGFSVGADILLSPSFRCADCVKRIILLDPNYGPGDLLFSSVLVAAGGNDPKGRSPTRRLRMKMLGELGDALENIGAFEAKMWYFSEVLHQLRMPAFSSASDMEKRTGNLAKYAESVTNEATRPFIDRISVLMKRIGKNVRVTLVASRDARDFSKEMERRLPSRVTPVRDRDRGHFDILDYDAVWEYISDHRDRVDNPDVGEYDI